MDVLCDGEDGWVAAILEHVERAGVHSGDSACVLPGPSVTPALEDEIRELAGRFAAGLGARGLLNVQLALHEGELHVLEANPRASRTVPFVAKATGMPLVDHACRLLLGASLGELDLPERVVPERAWAKEAIFPSDRFANAADRGVEMRSTGEVMASGATPAAAYRRALQAAGRARPRRGIGEPLQASAPRPPYGPSARDGLGTVPDPPQRTRRAGRIGAWTKGTLLLDRRRDPGREHPRRARGASRTGVPSLVAFLALGMLLGSDGPGGIDFDDAELARTVGVIGLAAILFEGGLSTSWRRLRQVAVPAALLSTVGVAVTTVLTGLAAHALFDLTWLESFLLGAVVASTDAAAVFATLRYTNIRRRLARTLEAETGGNDPMAIALTIGLIEWIQDPSFAFPDLALLVVRQLGLGLVVGVALGARRDVGVRAPPPLDRRVRAGRVGRGGLPVVRRGRRDRRQRVPGGLPRRPRGRQHSVALPAAARLLPRRARVPRPGGDVRRARTARVPARPAACRRSGARARSAARSRDPSRRRVDLDRAERLHGARTSIARVGWAARRRPDRSRDVRPLGGDRRCARRSSTRSSSSSSCPRSCRERRSSGSPSRLGLVSPGPAIVAPPIEVDPLSSLELVDFAVAHDHAIAGAAVRELGLPRSALVAVVARGDETIPPRGSTIVEPGDRLFVLVPRSKRAELEDVFARWRRRV